MCPCVRAPEFRYCVDQIETGLAELLFALKNKLRGNAPCDCKYCKTEAANKVTCGAAPYQAQLRSLITYCVKKSLFPAQERRFRTVTYSQKTAAVRIVSSAKHFLPRM